MGCGSSSANTTEEKSGEKSGPVRPAPAPPPDTKDDASDEKEDDEEEEGEVAYTNAPRAPAALPTPPKLLREAETVLDLCAAVLRGDLTTVQKWVKSPKHKTDELLSADTVPNSTLSFKNATVLHLAVFLGQFSIAQFLVVVGRASQRLLCEHISDSESRFHNVSAFHMVVALCALDMIELFLKSGADVQQICEEYVTYKYFYYSNVTVLHLACFRKDAVEVVDMLIKSKKVDAKILNTVSGEIRPHNETPNSGKPEAPLATGVSQSESNTKNRFVGVAPLHIAVALNREPLVQLFMQAGADVKVTCGEVSFKYKLSKRKKELANAQNKTGMEITHGFHSHAGKTATQLAYLTEREALANLMRTWKPKDAPPKA